LTILSKTVTNSVSWCHDQDHSASHEMQQLSKKGIANPVLT